jgi:hypothetical protein
MHHRQKPLELIYFSIFVSDVLSDYYPTAFQDKIRFSGTISEFFGLVLIAFCQCAVRTSQFVLFTK